MYWGAAIKKTAPPWGGAVCVVDAAWLDQLPGPEYIFAFSFS